ncbi:LuxR C-terminal-related transcriptional regulator [Ornithinibacillus halophilus]|uniref:AAA domain-containing protein n=1 Tax=Ornithinibacillus halophilus TaxID=930117 RepID=A0A1M5JU25_9BACI|nr:LuxR C-terminal-related transcriptional regulator [Ornithinibacillus halophilus]SHG44028.1 AAA domain-containing protein [Ornithinibacillus halophilus]
MLHQDRKNHEIVIYRKKELDLFHHFISDHNNDLKVLHIHGSGGVGKSFLLSEFEEIAKVEGMDFIKIEASDFPTSTKEFVVHITRLLTSTTDETPQNLQHCLRLLASRANKRRVVLAIDTFEEMDSLERWFRQVFLRYIDPNIFIVTAGRKPLRGDWVASPAWRRITTQIHLDDFNLNQTMTYLNFYGIHDEQTIQTIWQFTDGHPLSLSIVPLLNLREENHESSSIESDNLLEILVTLTKRWLIEVKDNDLQELVEAAAVLKQFDQTSLSTILGKEIPLSIFKELTDLSFVKKAANGWAIHDLISDAILLELRNQNPELLTTLSERCATFYYERTLQTRNSYDISQFFYHLGDDFIQSTFFLEAFDPSLYFEPVEEYNFHEVEHFFDVKRENITTSEAKFYNRETNTSYTFHASLAHNKKEMELIDSSYVKNMGYDVARILKDKTGRTRGLSIIVPVHQGTINELKSEPVSRHYFTNLTKDEFNEFNVPKEEKAGWFIRMFDYTDPSDVAARSFTLYHLFPLLLSGGRILVSNPLPFFQKLLLNFGFEEVPNATHYDYGEDVPSPTYLLDVRGPRLAQYLRQFMSKAKETRLKRIMDAYSFTDREKNIVKLILKEKQNIEIANELYVAEVTVKKHITRIFAKVGVKNRRQLIRKLMGDN